MNPFLLSQIFAGAAFVCGLTSFQFKTRRSILICLSFLTVFNSCHFFLLDRIGPGFLMILTGIRYVTAIHLKSQRIMSLFLVLSVSVGMLTFQGPLSLLSLTAVILGTIGSFQHSDRRMRACFMAGNSTWLLHNLLAASPVAALMEASFLSSNVLGYYRLYGRSEIANVQLQTRPSNQNITVDSSSNL